MRYLFPFLIITILASPLSLPQDGLLNKIKDKVEDKVIEQIDNKDKKDEPQKDENNQEETKEIKSDNPKAEKLSHYSKFDFVPGDKIIFYEDFSNDNIGDFPARWNTDNTGEVVSLNKFPGKWFLMKIGGVYVPEIKTTLPENFTIEYDLIYDIVDQYNVPVVCTQIYSATQDDNINSISPGNDGLSFSLEASYNSFINWAKSNYDINLTKEDEYLKNHAGQIVRVSINVQKTRVRIYLDQNKLYDIPRALTPNDRINTIRFDEDAGNESESKFYISNLRVAAGAADSRNKLVTEGKFVTHGILFDSGSDIIKSESYGTLKEIANVLKDNADIKIKIIGHTDSDGSDVANLELSKRRALAVKNSLANEFGVQISRMETDGKGESQPIDNNNTSEGKANNRRVEFVKL